MNASTKGLKTGAEETGCLLATGVREGVGPGIVQFMEPMVETLPTGHGKQVVAPVEAEA